MAFILSTSPAYWWPVKVSFPTDDGELATTSFDARFKRLPQTDYDALFAPAGDGEPPKTDVTVARRLVIGWRNVSDPDGKTIDFSPKAFDQLLEIQGVGSALVKAYLDSIRKAAEKN